MPASVTRTIGVSSSTQRLTWTYGNGARIRAYCWGGGGGGGGNDSAVGGSGAGGSFGYTEFIVNNGDIIDVAVGAGGGGGASGTAGWGGGAAGGAYLGNELFNTRSSNPGGWQNTQSSSYSQFLNSYGIWPNNYSVFIDYTWTITVPGGNYTIEAEFDYPGRRFIWNGSLLGTPRMAIDIDGTAYNFFVTPYGPYNNPVTSGQTGTALFNVTLSAGTHTIRVHSAGNTGFYQTASGSFGMRIGTAITAFSGGRGGNAGFYGSSGGGGGGGGATTVFVNGALIACGGGGGGGGGGGNGPVGDNAPGSAGQASPGINNGQNGFNKDGDGGGGGGAGGGYGGGQGGGCPGGDIGGQAGSNGGNFGSITTTSTGILAGGSVYPYYNPSWGRGGTSATNGTGGACVMEFFVSGVNVNTALGWQPVEETWIKVDNVWRKMQTGWIKVNNNWEFFLNSFAPVFSTNTSTWGVSTRVAEPNQGDVPPPAPIPDFGGGFDTGGWGGDIGSE